MFLFFVPGITILLLYVAAAVLPAIILLRYVYNQDKIEKEPTELLWALILRGVFAAFSAIVLEVIGETILNLTVSSDSAAYVIILAFLVVAVAEEGSKMFFLKRATWNNPNFDYLFDGLLYSVYVSLGFAAFENIKYVFSYGLGVAASRAIFAIPGHLGFSVVMGVFYGRAKMLANRGAHGASRASLMTGLILAIFCHGFYDACAMMGTALATLGFYGYVVIMYVVMYVVIRRESREDRPI